MDANTVQPNGKKHAVPHGRHAKRVAKKAARVAEDRIHMLEQKAAEVVERREEIVRDATRGLTSWVRRNPGTAIGVFLGAGAAITMLFRPRWGRAAMLGLSGLAASAYKRFR